ncbi:hypothetical protein AX774_g8013 [Zancudomyces culisetae]|uniref:Uncharacterized protein n=1 Tax=Zancudomyces culisetae TaxID=1213189 RepID=A0A1R1PCA4_ZANCU|nr:hypothetical protein AX774_g8013 [Zancudomyces culisetae]|eukprot:OMH78590.1 hypothetical protein AX774_g8013 [Zancudomyces culisetae]
MIKQYGKDIWLDDENFGAENALSTLIYQGIPRFEIPFAPNAEVQNRNRIGKECNAEEVLWVVPAPPNRSKTEYTVEFTDISFPSTGSLSRRLTIGTPDVLLQKNDDDTNSSLNTSVKNNTSNKTKRNNTRNIRDSVPVSAHGLGQDRSKRKSKILSRHRKIKATSSISLRTKEAGELFRNNETSSPEDDKGSNMRSPYKKLGKNFSIGTFEHFVRQKFGSKSQLEKFANLDTDTSNRDKDTKIVLDIPIPLEERTSVKNRPGNEKSLPENPLKLKLLKKSNTDTGLAALRPGYDSLGSDFEDLINDLVPAKDKGSNNTKSVQPNRLCHKDIKRSNTTQSLLKIDTGDKNSGGSRFGISSDAGRASKAIPGEFKVKKLTGALNGDADMNYALTNKVISGNESKNLHRNSVLFTHEMSALSDIASSVINEGNNLGFLNINGNTNPNRKKKDDSGDISSLLATIESLKIQNLSLKEKNKKLSKANSEYKRSLEEVEGLFYAGHTKEIAELKREMLENEDMYKSMLTEKESQIEYLMQLFDRTLKSSTSELYTQNHEDSCDPTDFFERIHEKNEINTINEISSRILQRSDNINLKLAQIKSKMKSNNNSNNNNSLHFSSSTKLQSPNSRQMETREIISEMLSNTQRSMKNITGSQRSSKPDSMSKDMIDIKTEFLSIKTDKDKNTKCVTPDSLLENTGDITPVPSTAPENDIKYQIPLCLTSSPPKVKNPGTSGSLYSISSNVSGSTYNSEYESDFCNVLNKSISFQKAKYNISKKMNYVSRNST